MACQLQQARFTVPNISVAESYHDHTRSVIEIIIPGTCLERFYREALVLSASTTLSKIRFFFSTTACPGISPPGSFSGSYSHIASERLLSTPLFISFDAMQSRKTITIVTSPTTKNKALPNIGSLSSPTVMQASLYRVEERSRTIYVSSDIDPSQWDTHSLNTIFSLAEAPECDREISSEQPVRRTQSYTDTQVIISEDVSDRSDESRVTSPRISVYRPRRSGGKTASAPSTPPPALPRRVSPSNSAPAARQRILFYHKDDPHYGFTNFSAHPVIYNGKKYPTSEHLFQSFKVGNTS